MNFIFSWQKQYFTNERSELVKYCCHSKIKFISSRHRVISSISFTHIKKVYILKLKIYDNRINRLISIERKSHLKYQGVLMDSNLGNIISATYIASNISSNIGIIARLRHFTPFVTILNIYRSLISPSISYGLISWGQAGKTHLNKILLLQKRAVRLMNFATFYLYQYFAFTITLKYCSIVMYDVYNKVVPSNISGLFTPTKDVHHYNTCSSTAGNFYILSTKSLQELFFHYEGKIC